MRRSRLKAHGLIVPAVLLLALPNPPLPAQSAYRYRDANGQWVFTDRGAAAAVATGDAMSLAREPEALHVSVDRSDTVTSTQLIAANSCLCVVTLRVSIVQSDFAAIPKGANYQATLEPGVRQTLVNVPRPSSGKGQLEFNWRAALGSPKAVHNPPRPYRVPFAVGSTFTISFPSKVATETPSLVRRRYLVSSFASGNGSWYLKAGAAMSAPWGEGVAPPARSPGEPLSGTRGSG